MQILIVIPARGGSKGISGKNMRAVAGVSLVARAVFAAREFVQHRAHDTSFEFTVFVDTDSPEIAAEGLAWGAEVPFLRPADLARDTTSSVDSVLHAVDRFSGGGRAPAVVLLLQPTSPLRTASDIGGCWDAFVANGNASVISTVEASHPLQLALRATDAGTLDWLTAPQSSDTRRQAFAPVQFPSGAVYIINTLLLRNTRSFVVPGVTRGVPIASERTIDIDTPSDLLAANALAHTAPVSEFKIGAAAFRRERSFVIAQSDVRLDGDVRLAHRLIDAAADAGVDAVNVPAFESELLESSSAARRNPGNETDGGHEAMLHSMVIPPEAYREVQAHAQERGLNFLSTPFDERSADFLEELNVVAFRIFSGETANHQLLHHLARMGRPVLMSSGLASMASLAAAVLALREPTSARAPAPLALLHSVTGSPAVAADCNLRAMASMRALFGVPAGWSDQTMGLDITLAAVALGADVIEKPFTLDRALPGALHKASLEPRELAALVRSVRAVNAAAAEVREQ